MSPTRFSSFPDRLVARMWWRAWTPSALIISALVCFAGLVRADGTLLPENKEALQLDETERNPFARRVPVAAAIVIEEAENEETRLQKILSGMEVTGFRDGPDGTSVLLGRFWLRVGDELRTLIPKQSEILRVENIRPDRVEFVFLEADDRPLTRTFTLRYNRTPTVRYLLGTQLTPPARNNLDLQGTFPPLRHNQDEENAP